MATHYGVAKFYDCPSIDKFLEQMPALSQRDKSSTTVITHVWFAQFLDCDMDTIEMFLHNYNASRGLPNTEHSAALFPVIFSSHQADACSNKQAIDPDDQNRFES